MRQARLIIFVLAVLAALGFACSQPARYRVLTFFFDGVPEPGSTPPSAADAGRSQAEKQARTQARRAAVRQPVSVHAPYAIDRCDACHDAFSGQLHRTVEAGLCASCHPTVPAPTRFLHGPAAARACGQCHLPHSSGFPKLLTAQDPSLCFQCHLREDLSRAPHEMLGPQDACTYCHDPHGGDDRYFLKLTDLEDSTGPG